MTFSFVHAADLHLDTPFSGIGQLSARAAETLQDASLDAFDALVELTLAEEARFLLLAGDLYDGAERGIRAQRRLERGLQRLGERGIATFIVHGNHDPFSGWSAIRTWPSHVTVFGDQDVTSVTLEAAGLAPVTIHGISYRQARMEENLSRRYRRTDQPGLQIGLLHCEVDATGEAGSYSPCSLDDLRSTGMDYWALGHIHRRQILSQTPWVVYPGNLQGRSPKPSERGPKGAMVVRVEGKTILEPRFEPLDRIRFETLRLDVAGIGDVATLHRSLVERSRELQAQSDGRGLILRASLVGRGDLYSELRHPGRLEEILAELRREGDNEESLIWWEDLRNEAAPAIDLESIRQRGDFSAEVMRLQAERMEDPGLREAFLRDCLSPLDRFKGLLGLPDDQEQTALLKEAEMLALDLLEQE